MNGAQRYCAVENLRGSPPRAAQSGGEPDEGRRPAPLGRARGEAIASRRARARDGWALALLFASARDFPANKAARADRSPNFRAALYARIGGLAGLVLWLAACVTSPVEEARLRDSAEAQVGLAQAYLQQNDARQALPAALKAVELDPKSVDAYLTLGRIQHVERRWEQALEAYQKAVALDPKRGETYYLIGVVRYELKDVAGAIESLRKALTQPTYLTPQDSHLYLGGIFMDQGKLDDALTEFRKAVDVEPEFGFAHNALGYALLLKQRPEEAIEALSKAVRFAPTLVAAHRNLGVVYLQVGKKEEARASFRKVVELAPAGSPMAAEAKKALAELGGDGPAPAAGAASGAPAPVAPASALPPPGGPPRPTAR